MTRSRNPNFVSLAKRKRSSRYRRFECRLLSLVDVLRFSIMAYPPLAGVADDLIGCKSHKKLPLNVCWFPATCPGQTSWYRSVAPSPDYPPKACRSANVTPDQSFAWGRPAGILCSYRTSSRIDSWLSVRFQRSPSRADPRRTRRTGNEDSEIPQALPVDGNGSGHRAADRGTDRDWEIVTGKMSCAKWTSKGRLMFAPRNAVMCRSIGASAWASLQTQAAPPSRMMLSGRGAKSGHCNPTRHRRPRPDPGTDD